MDAVLDRSAKALQGNSGSRKLTVVSHQSRRQPNGGQSAISQESSQAVGVELIRLVDMPHQHLCFGSVGDQRNAPGGLDLVGDSIPVADGFQRNGCLFWEVAEVFSDGTTLVHDSPSVNHPAASVLNLKLRVALMSVAPYTQHAACLSADRLHLLGSDGLPPSVLVGQRFHTINSLKPTWLGGEIAVVPDPPNSYRMKWPSPSRRAAELEAVGPRIQEEQKQIAISLHIEGRHKCFEVKSMLRY